MGQTRITEFPQRTGLGSGNTDIVLDRNRAQDIRMSGRAVSTSCLDPSGMGTGQDAADDNGQCSQA